MRPEIRPDRSRLSNSDENARRLPSNTRQQTDPAKTIQKPFRDLLPPLSTTEMDTLRADIEANGVRDPVIIDENGVVLDGHHRLMIDPEAPTHVIPGVTTTSLASPN